MGGNSKKRKSSGSEEETSMTLTAFGEDSFVFVRRSTSRESVDIFVVLEDGEIYEVENVGSKSEGVHDLEKVRFITLLVRFSPVHMFTSHAGIESVEFVRV